MPEVGIVPLARHAIVVAGTVLPQYRSKFSKHQFTQPQLLALLCVMSYEDWTFREAEVRQREHRELRRALGLRTIPDYTTLYRCLRRVDETALAPPWAWSRSSSNAAEVLARPLRSTARGSPLAR